MANTFPGALPEKNTVLTSVSAQIGDHVSGWADYTPLKLPSFSYHEGDADKDGREYGRNILLICCGEDFSDLKDLVSNNKHLALNTFTKNSKTICDILKRYVAALSSDVWLYITKDSLSREPWMVLIGELIDTRKNAMKPLNLPKTFNIRLLLQADEIHSRLPRSVQNLFHISTPLMSHKQIGDVLTGTYDNRLNKISSTLFKDPAPILVVTLTLHSNGDTKYMERSYMMLRELMEDPTSNVRQELLHLYRIPNVHIIKNKDPSEIASLRYELRPVEISKFTLFLQAIDDGTMRDIFETRLLVQGSVFRGEVLVEYRDGQVKDVKEKLQEETTSTLEHKGLSLKSIIVTRVYIDFLRDTRKTPYEYLQYWKTKDCEDFLLDIRDISGKNALHLAIASQRIDYLWMLLYSGVWGVLRGLIVTNDADQVSSLHKGYTPHRVAQALSMKVKGFEVMCEYDYIDQMWLNLPSILKACLQGTIDMVKILAESKPQVLQSIDIHGGNSMLYACASGNKDLVKYLVQKKIPVDCRNRRRDTGLHIAAMFGHTSILEVLSKEALDFKGQRNSVGYNALDYCAMNGDIASLQLYEKKRALDSHALTVAVKYQKHDVLQFLLNNCQLDVNLGEDAEGRSSLHHAVINSDCIALDMLLAKDADISKTDMYNRSVFHLVAEKNSVEVFDQLVAKAAVSTEVGKLLNMRDYYTGKHQQFLVRGKDNGRRAWHWIELKPLHNFVFNKALKSGQIDVAKHGKIICSGFGPSPNEEQRENIRKLTSSKLEEKILYWSPLHVAVDQQCTEIVERLLANKANANETDQFGVAPVHLACMRGNLDIIKLLDNAGADMMIATADAQTAEEIAQFNSHYEIINFLQGMNEINKAKRFVETCMNVRSQELSSEELLKKRESGVDLRRHIVSILRDMTIDINELLLQLGSGPVMEVETQ